ETENQRTKPGRNVQRDPEQDDLIEGEVECPDRIDAAEGKDGHQSVVVDQSREEHPEDLPMASEFGERRSELSKCPRDHAADVSDGFGVRVAHPRKHGYCEHGKPNSYEQVGCADTLAAPGRKAEPARFGS